MSMVASLRAARRVDGLSVVEVLVAIVILGIVTAAIVTTYVSSIRNNADAGRGLRASRY